MLEEIALVVEADSELLWIETRTRSSCSHCANDTCGTSVLAKIFAVKRNRVQLENTLAAEAGEQVIIGMPDDLLVRAAIWAYLVPLIAMVLFTLIASMAGASDGLQSLLAMAGLAIGFLVVQKYTTGSRSKTHFKPRLLRKVNQIETAVKPIKLSRNI